MADLKPCPFCGSTPRYLPTNPGFYTARVICDHCHFHLPVSAWQQRKTSDGVEACRKCGAKRGEPCAGNWTTCEGSAAHIAARGVALPAPCLTCAANHYCPEHNPDTRKPWEKSSWTCARAMVNNTGMHCPPPGERCPDCPAPVSGVALGEQSSKERRDA